MASRPTVSVWGTKDGKIAPASTTTLPTVFLTPVRSDVVVSVTTSMSKNRRQAYAVKFNAGHELSAESWGTGRAVSRIPRVSGSGTHRAGQGAFGNMCRGGRMFAPNRVWRKWHRQVNLNQRRYALTSALAASAVPALVMARGHRINGVAEVPLVVDSSVEGLKKTRDAVALLKATAAYEDVDHVRASKQLRSGSGKMRNRRYVQRRGPLVIYAKDDGIVKAFRNIPGVELACVERLNLLQLAPGGHLGRFCIWSQAAFARLDAIYGSYRRNSEKAGYKLPRAIMTNSDLARIINSDEVQSVVRAKKSGSKGMTFRKRNPLRNMHAMTRVNPNAPAQRRESIKQNAANRAKRVASQEAHRAGKHNKATKEQLKQAKADKARKAKFVATFN